MITRSGFTRSITGGYQRAPHGRRDMAGIAAMGRNGDTELAHVNPQEAAVLKAMGGSGTVNPKTGLREYALGGGPGSQSESSGGSTTAGYHNGGGFSSNPDIYGEQQAFNAAMDAYRSGESGAGGGGDLYSEQQAFNAALSNYANTGGVYTGPAPGLGGTVDKGRWDRSQPTGLQKAVAFGVGAAMPFGVDAEARANYIEGRPELAMSWNPVGALANMGMGPLGDVVEPDWANIEMASVPFGEAQHAPHTGRSEGQSGGQEMDAQINQLLRSVLQPPAEASKKAPDTRAKVSAPPPQRFVPFEGDYRKYSQPGGGAGHRFLG